MQRRRGAQRDETKQSKNSRKRNCRIDGRLGDGIDFAQPLRHGERSISGIRKVDSSTGGVDDEHDSEIRNDGADPEKLRESAVAH